jgi:hypothetical protein
VTRRGAEDFSADDTAVDASVAQARGAVGFSATINDLRKAGHGHRIHSCGHSSSCGCGEAYCSSLAPYSVGTPCDYCAAGAQFSASNLSAIDRLKQRINVVRKQKREVLAAFR